MNSTHLSSQDRGARPNAFAGERLWALTLAAGTVAITNVPYLIGWFRQTPDVIFSGILFDAIDANAYLAVMQEGWRGLWLMRLPYSVEPHSPLFLYEFYILLGHLSRWLGLSPLVGYHVARGGCGLWMLWAAHEYLRAHISRGAVRRIAFILLCVGSGFGWLMQIVAPAGPAGISPIDFWLMDAYAFFSILLVPHFAATWALALTLLTSVSRAALQPGRLTALVAFLAGLGLAIVNPKVAPAMGAVAMVSASVLAWQIRRRSGAVLGVLAASGTGVALPALYYAYLFKTDPIFAALAHQDITMSPPPIYYLLGLGVVALLAFVGAVKVLQRRRARELPLLIWPLVVGILLYAPVQIQRRFIMGVQVPLAGLAGIGLVAIVLPALRRTSVVERLGRIYPPRRLRLLALNLTLAASSLSNILLLTGYSLAAWLRAPEMFIPRDVAEAADWLGAADSDLTLSAYPTGNYIQARSGARTCIGHWNLTIDFYAKQDVVRRIFDSATDAIERERLVRAMGCRYVFYGPYERALGSFQPQTADFLRLRYANGSVAIYEVSDGR